MYPDEYNKYRNVFFQNLIFAMAMLGLTARLFPVPVTKFEELAGVEMY